MRKGWKPCDGCEEVCDRIWKLLVGYLMMMDYNVTKENVWAFWRTFCAFAVRENDTEVLEWLYDCHMSAWNKAKATKTEFVSHMMKGVSGC